MVIEIVNLPGMIEKRTDLRDPIEINGSRISLADSRGGYGQSESNENGNVWGFNA